MTPHEEQAVKMCIYILTNLYTSYLQITLSPNSNGGFPTPDKSNFPR